MIQNLSFERTSILSFAFPISRIPSSYVPLVFASSMISSSVSLQISKTRKFQISRLLVSQCTWNIETKPVGLPFPCRVTGSKTLKLTHRHQFWFVCVLHHDTWKLPLATVRGTCLWWNFQRKNPAFERYFLARPLYNKISFWSAQAEGQRINLEAMKTERSKWLL